MKTASTSVFTRIAALPCNLLHVPTASCSIHQATRTVCTASSKSNDEHNKRRIRSRSGWTLLRWYYSVRVWMCEHPQDLIKRWLDIH